MTPRPGLSRREFLGAAAMSVAGLGLCRRAPAALAAGDPDQARLADWIATLRAEGLAQPGNAMGNAAGRTGELACGTPYEAGTLEAYLRDGSGSATEPLTLSLTRFDCVTLVESCLAVARSSLPGDGPAWTRFGAAVERMRYRGGRRAGYLSRLHYFSEWIQDGERRGLVHDLGRELGGIADTRPLRFMTTHRSSYPAMRDDGVYAGIGEMERRLDGMARWVIPTPAVVRVAPRLMTGDVLAFATSIDGLDVTHAALAYRDRAGTMRVLHAPLSGGVVEVAPSPLPEYVGAIRRATGILVARPFWGLAGGDTPARPAAFR